MTTAGDAGSQAGMAAHVYLITKSMVDQNFYNADGEMMFVAQEGNLRLVTEFGIIDIEPGEIAVIPRGVKFRVEITGGPARGYLCENYGGAFTLPERSCPLRRAMAAIIRSVISRRALPSGTPPTPRTDPGRVLI